MYSTSSPEVPSPGGSEGARRFDVRSANDWGLPPQRSPPGGPYRSAIVSAGIVVAVLASSVLILTEHGVALLRWSLPGYLELAAVSLGLGVAGYFARPPPPIRAAEVLELSATGARVRFSDGSSERIGWGDPELDAGIGEGRGLAAAPDRVLIGLWEARWKGPALITPEARDAFLAAAATHDLRFETQTEESGRNSRSTTYLRPPARSAGGK
jgi:hypothetical protein